MSVLDEFSDEQKKDIHLGAGLILCLNVVCKSGNLNIGDTISKHKIENDLCNCQDEILKNENEFLKIIFSFVLSLKVKALTMVHNFANR